MAAGVLTQRQVVSGHTHRLRSHDLVAQRIADHPVLVDTSLMSKGIAADNGLIGLRAKADDLGQEATGRIKLLSVDRGANAKLRFAY